MLDKHVRDYSWLAHLRWEVYPYLEISWGQEIHFEYELHLLVTTYRKGSRRRKFCFIPTCLPSLLQATSSPLLWRNFFGAFITYFLFGAPTYMRQADTSSLVEWTTSDSWFFCWEIVIISVDRLQHVSHSIT